MSGDSFDLVVIGGGIVGLATALALGREQGLSLAVLESESRLADHQTGHNSGVIHSGLYYRPGSLKARLCREGREALIPFCQQNGIPFENCGKVVVASEESELVRLAELEKRGRENGLAGVKRIGPEELSEREPHVRGVAGLWVPQTGIVEFRQVAEAMAATILERGGEIRTSSRVLGIRRQGGGRLLETASGPVACRHLITCGGLHADRLARMDGQHPSVRILPFRGEYHALRPERRHLVRNLIYPVPDPRFPFLGVHFTRRIDGSVECGPNAVLALKREGYRKRDVSPADVSGMLAWPGSWRMASRYWRTGLKEVVRSFSRRKFARALAKLIPEVGPADIRPAGAGVRAQAVGRDGKLVDDFEIVSSQGAIHVLNAPSPAATASLAIGRYIAELARRQLLART
ncbi:MAG: L-2-hydroxyglutarate oxidase [Planctomycetota bacterium]